MTVTVEFFFDFGSPTAYLACRRLLQLREHYDMAIRFRPMLLGGVFKATENASPVTIPASWSKYSTATVVENRCLRTSRSSHCLWACRRSCAQGAM